MYSISSAAALSASRWNVFVPGGSCTVSLRRTKIQKQFQLRLMRKMRSGKGGAEALRVWQPREGGDENWIFVAYMSAAAFLFEGGATGTQTKVIRVQSGVDLMSCWG